MQAIIWENDKLRLLDQTILPLRKEYVTCTNYKEVADAIRTMKVRGAPAIGVSAAYGMALAAREIRAGSREELMAELEKASKVLLETRPTAVNLRWALERMMNLARSAEDWQELPRILAEEARRIEEEDIEVNRRMGRHGAELLPEKATVLTHCNAGALATAGYGTALGVIRAAVEMGKDIKVFADETRPFLQGARLTAFELMEDKIPVTLITDNMAGWVMKLGKVDAVLVGADRIAANGDTANKIGTYSVAVLAKENNVPFYVVAPSSTFDLSIETGEDIPIEERNPREVVEVLGQRIAPEGVAVFNPAFDVTPAKYITGIVTENGVARPPYEDSLRVLAEKSGVPRGSARGMGGSPEKQ